MPFTLASVPISSHAWYLFILWYGGRVGERDAGVEDEVRVRDHRPVARKILETKSRHRRAEGFWNDVRGNGPHQNYQAI